MRSLGQAPLCWSGWSLDVTAAVVDAARGMGDME
jgi:hypothetical protein